MVYMLCNPCSMPQNNVGFDVQGHCFYIEVRGLAGC